MIIITDPSQLHIRGNTAVTVGKFDGMHRGHRLLLEKTEACKAEGLETCVFTFDFSGFFDPPRPTILTFEETVAFLEKWHSIDYLVRAPVSEAFFGLSWRTFLENNLLRDLHMKRVICGDDFCFGRNRQGTPDILKKMAPELGYDVEVVPRIVHGRDFISSTRIRKDLLEGSINDANACLGYTFPIEGYIVHGRHLGEKWGFPTANIVPGPEKLLPRYGVYGVRAEIDGKEFNGIANIGVKPTVSDDKTAMLEVHVFDMERDLYGKRMKVLFDTFIRPEQRFESKKALIRQVKKDIKSALEYQTMKGIEKND